MILKNRQPKPKSGEKKNQLEFAFFPMWVEDKLIWLERYISCYEYEFDMNYGFMWVEKSRKLINKKSLWM